MATTVKFYHAGCPVCVEAENSLVDALDRGRYSVETIHLGDTPSRLGEAQAEGVQSVPALVMNGQVLHINHGAELSALN